MRYKNNSKFKMLIQLEKSVKEVLPNEVFSCAEDLNYGFLEKLDPNAALNLADSIAPPAKKYKKRTPKKKKVVIEAVLEDGDLKISPEDPVDGSDNSEG